MDILATIAVRIIPLIVLIAVLIGTFELAEKPFKKNLKGR